MVRNKGLLTLAIGLFLVNMVLNFPFPNKQPLGVSIFTALHIPIEYKNWQFVGITSIILLLLGFNLLFHSLRVYNLRFSLLAFILVASLPPRIADAYQDTLATGIYAVTYNGINNHCDFNMVNEKVLDGKCTLLFENHSRKPVHFTVELYEPDRLPIDSPMNRLMNYHHAPYDVELKGHEQKSIQIENKVDVSHVNNHVEAGQSNDMRLIIRSGKSVRKL